ncbi:hypothetical protein FRC12_011573 [Ceratobasidium sp. 428]|nr:hypothetical protein FRC09_014232 [Ceratobasidium sp. 395]KAG8753355.1 hypothetical protein FRC12_011573 [Ceratobasidium sp. 428]
MLTDPVYDFQSRRPEFEGASDCYKVDIDELPVGCKVCSSDFDVGTLQQELPTIAGCRDGKKVYDVMGHKPSAVPGLFQQTAQVKSAM